MNKLKILVVLFVLTLLSFILAVIDININQAWGTYFQIFPVVFIIVSLISYYSKYKWWYIAMLLLPHALVYNNPILGLWVIILLIYFFDILTTKIFQRRTLIYVISYSVFINLILYLNSKVSVILLKKIFLWEYLAVKINFQDYQQVLILTLITTLVVILLHPLISIIDIKKSLYTNN